MKTVALYCAPKWKDMFLKQFASLEDRELAYVWAGEGEMDLSLLHEGGVDVVVEALEQPQQAGRVIKTALESGLTVVASNTVILGAERDAFKNVLIDKGARLITSGAVWGDGRFCAEDVESRSARIFLMPGGESSTLIRYMRDENMPFDEAVALYAEVHGLAEGIVRERVAGKGTLRRADLMREQALSSVKGIVRPAQGLDHVQVSDILLAERMGYTIRLTADIRIDGVSVAPFLFDRNSPIAHVDEEDEAMWVALPDHSRLMTYRNYQRAFVESVMADVKNLPERKMRVSSSLSQAPSSSESLYFLRGDMGLISFCKDHPSMSVVSDSLMAKESVEGVIVRTQKPRAEMDRLTSEFGVKMYNVFQGNDAWYQL